MLKRILLAALFVGLIGILVAGAVMRTMDKTEQVAEARGYGRVDGEAGATEAGGAGQGRGAYGQASGRGRAAGRGDTLVEALPQEWLAYEGSVVQTQEAGGDLVIQTPDGEELTVGTGPDYMASQGFALQAGEPVHVRGYWHDGEFKAAQVTRLADGQAIALRDEFGRPAWAGAGRNAQSGGQGREGAAGDQSGTGQAQVEAWLTIEGGWSNGATGGGSCTTDASGQCSIVKGNLKGNVASVTFSASNVTSGVGAYAPGDNHDPDGDSDGTAIVVSQPAENTPPTATITAPSDGATFASGAKIDFSGTASDTEDGDVTASLVWTSDIDGQIGTGGSFSAVLTDGVHAITAEATDSGGASGSDTVGITVGNPPTVHVGDLDGAGAPVRSKWEATVTITVHDQDHAPLANAAVAGTWSSGATGGAECTTDGSGQCSVSKGNLKFSVASVTFAVDSVTLTGYSYAPFANHDPDGDSDGTSVTVSAP